MEINTYIQHDDTHHGSHLNGKNHFVTVHPSVRQLALADFSLVVVDIKLWHLLARIDRCYLVIRENLFS